MSDAGGVGDFFGGDGAGGARGAIDAARGEFDQAKAAAAGAQLPLIPGDEIEVPDLAEAEAYVSLPDAAEILQLQMETGLDLHQAIQEHRRRRGQGGRKPGAKNRSNLDFQRYLLQFGPQPGVTQMRFLARPVDQLAAELGCSKLEAAQLQIKCDDNLTPYFASKMPVAVAHSFAGDVTIQFMGGAPIDGGELVSESGDDMLAGLSFADGSEVAEISDLADGEASQSE